MEPIEGPAAIVLAAGKGTRMKSGLAKVLFPFAGRPIVHRVLDAVEEAGFARTVVVVGYQHERVREELAGRGAVFALQEPQLGTGHAVQCAAPLLDGFAGDVVVLAGDVPLIRARTLRALMDRHASAKAAVTILTAVLPDAAGYGRIVRDAAGRVAAIVEHGDATPEQRGIREFNSSIYAFRWPFLAGALPRLRTENEQAELYLTDTVRMAVDDGLRVEGMIVEDIHELAGINTREQLAEAERLLEERGDA